MQFDEFDNKIKEAAENHHPAYTEEAWGKMEKLLNSHLPQKKEDDKRFVFFILLFLLTGGGLFLLLRNHSSRSPAQISRSGIQKTIAKPSSEGPTVNLTKNKQLFSEPLNNLQSTDGSNITLLSLDKQNNKPAEKTRRLNAVLKADSKNVKDNINLLTTEPIKKTNDATLPPVNDPVVNSSSSDKNKNDRSTSVAVSNDIKKNNEVIKPTPVTNQGINTVAADRTNLSQQNKTEKPNKGTANKFRNNLFFFASTGLDASYIPDEKMGKVKLFGGLGAGYRINKKLSVSAGIFAGRKVYTSSAKGYDPPPNFWIYYPYLEKVNANCKVYELPLTLTYQFNSKKQGNLFASAGVSSLFMKEENYSYSYKTNPNGPLLNRNWTLYNKNRHYFSLLTLSGGYNRQIGKNSSLSVSPYLKIPMTGIGYGRVKLNSGGLMVTMKISPFQTQKKNK